MIARFYPCVLLVAAALPAQLPTGFGLQLAAARPGNPAPTAMQWVDVTGRTRSSPVTGLPPSFANPASGVLDPVTGEVVLGGAVNVSVLSAHRVAGAAVAASRTLAVLPVLTSPSAGQRLELVAVDFDRNGNYFTANFVEVLRVERHSGAVTVWDAPRAPHGGPGLLNAMTIDRERNKLYVGTNSFIVGTPAFVWEYDLAIGPKSRRVVVDGRTTPNLDGEISGLHGDGSGKVYLSTSGMTGPSVMVYDAATSTTVPVPGAPPGFVSGIGFDRDRRLLHLVQLVGPSGYLTLDPQTGTRTVIAPRAPRPGTVLTGLAINDLVDRTQIFPREPSVAAPFTFEAAAWGRPGDVAALAITAFNGQALTAPVVLTAGLVDGSGRLPFTHNLDPTGLQPGSRLSVLSARIDAMTGAVVIGSTVDVCFQP